MLGVLAFEGQVEVEPQVAAAFAETVARAQTLGLKVETVRLPDYNFGRMRRLGLLISEAEGYVVHQATLSECPEGFSDGFRTLLEWAADYRGVGCRWTGCPVAALPAHASAAGRVHHDGHRLAARQRLPTRRDGRGDSSGHQLRGDL